MRYTWCKVLLLTCLIIVPSALMFGGNGKITGTVKDASTGEVVVGANVMLEGTSLGAAADVNGTFYILNVPPGTYTLVASAVGYARAVTRNVRVGSDQIVTLNIAMRSESVDLKEVVIEAQQKVVDPSQTNAKTRMSSEEISTLPLRSVSDIVSTSPSVYQGFIRGGKQFETKTLIDGVDVTDQFYAAAAEVGSGATTPYMTYNGVMRQSDAKKASLVGLNIASVEEANVLTGGVGADYSSATAGLISYSLREGRGGLVGNVRFKTSSGGLKHMGPDVYNDGAKYLAERDTLRAQALRATPVNQANLDKANRYTWSPDKYGYGEKPTMDGEISIGGELMKNLGIYFTGGLFSSYGRLPNEYTQKVNSSIKLTYSPISNLKFNIVGILEDRGQLFGWKNSNFSEDFRFFLEGIPRWDGVNYVGSIKMTHALSPNTYYELQASFVYDNKRQGYVDGNNDGVVGLNEDGDFMTFADTAQANRYMANAGNAQFTKFFSPTPRNESASESILSNANGTTWKLARPGLFYEDFKNSNVTLKGDITSQVTNNHQLRAGFQARFHDLDRTLRAAYIGGVFSTYRNYVEEVWNVKPKEISGYIQDKMEYAGLIINIGARVDGLDLAAADYANWFGPFADTKDAAGGSIRVPVRSENVKTKFFFSPRLGVSHPISDNAAMYFSFSRQTQTQPFSRLFSNYNDFGNPSLPVVTRTNQDPIESTNYDLGVQWSFTEGYGVDINAYFKDIQNYGGFTGIVVAPKVPWRQFQIGTDFGYADSRGVELTLRKTMSPVIEDVLSIGGRVTYAYSYIKQAIYAGGNQTNFSTVAGDSAKYGGQIPWGDIQSWNTIEQNVRGGNSSLTGGYDRTHRVTYTMMMRFPYDIMVSSVGRFESGFFYNLSLGDPRARELGTGPWNKQVDLRVEKSFALDFARISLFVDILNVFDWKNVLAYDSGNIGQLEWERNGDPTGGPKAPRPTTQDGSLIYDLPREIYVGFSINF